MKIVIDDINRIHLIDEYTPYGSIIFDVTRNRVAVYQDSSDQKTRTKFEEIEEAAEFEKYELIDALKEIAETLEGME